MSDPEAEEPQTECDSCRYDGAPLKSCVHRLPRGDKQVVQVCELCYATMTSTALQYPSQFGESAEVMRTICFVGNTILAAIKEIKDGPIQG